MDRTHYEPDALTDEEVREANAIDALADATHAGQAGGWTEPLTILVVRDAGDESNYCRPCYDLHPFGTVTRTVTDPASPEFFCESSSCISDDRFDALVMAATAPKPGSLHDGRLVPEVPTTGDGRPLTPDEVQAVFHPTLTNEAEAEAWLRLLVSLGLDTHPDDSFVVDNAPYIINGRLGTWLTDVPHGHLMDAAWDALHATGYDPYIVLLEDQRRWDAENPEA